MDYVFNDKNMLAEYIAKEMQVGTKLRLHKMMYVLYKMYLLCVEENPSFPKTLFEANFEVRKYGPIDRDLINDPNFNNDALTNHQTLKGQPSSYLENQSLDVEHAEALHGYLENIIQQANKLDDWALFSLTLQDTCVGDAVKNGYGSIIHPYDIKKTVYKQYSIECA